MSELAKVEVPNFNWYKSESQRMGLKPRCPFQSVHACPRYYQSLSLSGEAGATSIPAAEDAELLERWKRHPMWPSVTEQAPGISESSTKVSFHNFCPEVLFDRFGFFARYLAPYADELDRDRAQKRLSDEGVPRSDPRWRWASCVQQHYAECPTYSALDHGWPKQVSTFSRILPPDVRYDVFISHASEDKEAFVAPLAAQLSRLGLRVWFDKWELRLGSSLRATIDDGLLSSAYGVVVLSPSFFKKNWAQAELNALFAIEMSGNRCILPVLHNLTHKELTKFSPLTASMLSTDSTKGVADVAQEIARAVKSFAQAGEH